MTETIAKLCPKCQAPLPANAPQGLCPKCLLAAAAMPTEAGQAVPGSANPPPLATIAAAFPQLEILEIIGSGGMGVVYKARQPRLDRCVALKLLPQALAADATFAERFNREARLLARLNHPNIVTVHDFGQSDGFFFLLMEYVDGVNLRQAMEAGRFTPHQALALVPKICEALQYAHDEGVLHRDIKPSNILLDTRGRVKIADFGIAKLLGDHAQDATLTASGAAIGTPQYMAPEQLEHPQDVDQRADIYSLGVVFYEMLTGELPIGRFAPPSEKAAVDARVDEVVFRALEKEREKRFHSAGEVKTSVEAITASGRLGVKANPAAGKAIAERRMRCYLSTPKHLGTLTGKIFYPYTGKGELRLDAEQLTFVSNWDSIVIPLTDIRELGIGHYSRLAKPLRLDYLAVSFEQAGLRRTLLFTPAGESSIVQIPWEVNERVAECFQAVRVAVIIRTGSAPAGPAAPTQLPRPLAFALRGALMLAFLVFFLGAGVALLVVVLRRPDNAPAPAAIPIVYDGAWMLLIGSGVLLAAGLIGTAIILMRRSRTLDDILATQFSPSLTGTVVSPTVANPAARRATCYFSTLQRMRNCFPGPAAHIFLCKGELILEAERLRFVTPWQTEVVIWLKDIQDLSIGQFKMWHTPWVMKYERLNFISLTFAPDGQEQTVHLTPTAPGAVSTDDLNAQTAAWFKSIQEAVITLTGQAPAVSEPEAVSVSAQPAWNRKGVPLTLGSLLALLLAYLVPGQVMDPLALSLLVASGLLMLAGGWYSVGFLQANHALKHGHLDAVTSDDPPTGIAVSGLTGTVVK